MKRFALLTSILLVFAATARADFIRIEENHPSVTYTGNWNVHASPYLSGGRLVAGALGSTATVTFTGTGIRWIEYFSNQVRGGAKLYIDGVLLGTTRPRDSGVIDVRGEKQLRYTISGLTDTTHTLTIEGTGVPYGFPPNITIDAFYVERGGVTQLIQESDPSITYSGDWVEYDDPGVSGGSVLASSDPGATATVNYDGDAISWISYLCPCASGIASVQPYNGIQATWNAYAPERVPQAMIFNRPGGQLGVEKQITIEVTGENAGGGPWVVIDAFRIQTGSNDGPDNTSPEITLRLPEEGAIVGGRVPLVADYFDNEGVTSVSYYVDGAPAVIDVTQNIAKLTTDTWWTTTGVSASGPVTPIPDGPHVLTAVARDAAGNETTSAPVNVIVDNSQPTITLTAPASGSQVTGVVTITAEVVGNHSDSGVSFHARASDGTYHFLGKDSTAPYSLTADTRNVPSGRTFELTATVHNRVGSVQVVSPAISVTVQH